MGLAEMTSRGLSFSYKVLGEDAQFTLPGAPSHTTPMAWPSPLARAFGSARLMLPRGCRVARCSPWPVAAGRPVRQACPTTMVQS
jgi:hypothetical protein